ncbi:hypothetical protein M514_03914 [Trichuris suis]|uniref:Uncharacterized protein n=1 Tax=Trichuris suis TaxID=68888 RepID=A0A085N8Y6_9BILA|nr:hypothetical protein M513_03914 [Trichuris suis]KFD65932.1 hypothetical protein M514_03914 [Trichuris suis]
MKITITLFIYSLFTAEVYSFGPSASDVFGIKDNDSFKTDANYMQHVKTQCKRVFQDYPQLTPQHYEFPRLTEKKCTERPFGKGQRAGYGDVDLERKIRKDDQYILLAVRIYAGEYPTLDDYWECDRAEPMLKSLIALPIDCGAFDDSCIYRRLIRDHKWKPPYIVIDGARIVKRITRVIKGTINYRVTLILSLGNGTYMNLNYTVNAFSYVEINQTDPFYFAHGDFTGRHDFLYAFTVHGIRYTHSITRVETDSLRNTFGTKDTTTGIK